MPFGFRCRKYGALLDSAVVSPGVAADANLIYMYVPLVPKPSFYL